MSIHRLLCQLASKSKLVSPIRLVSLLTILLHYEFLVFFIVTDFDFVFHVIRPEQPEMVSIQEIIAIQKREEDAQKVTAQKQQQSTKKADQGPPNAKRQLSISKGREKGITIKEGAPRPNKQLL